MAVTAEPPDLRSVGTAALQGALKWGRPTKNGNQEMVEQRLGGVADGVANRDAIGNKQMIVALGLMLRTHP